jgi:RNA-binding protein
VKGKVGRRLRAVGQAIDPTLFVGRDGATDAVAAEARAQLKDRPLIKVKITPRAEGGASRHEVAAELARKAGAELVEVRGFTAVLASRRRPTEAAPRRRREGSSRRPTGASGAKRGR